jgi:hypothetical protein
MGGAATVTPGALTPALPFTPATPTPATFNAAPVVATPLVAVQPPVVAHAPAAVAPPMPAFASAPAPVSVSAPVSVAAPAGHATAALVLAIIAEKTGYPVEVLAPDMDLEADLGIDSIKRVEILAAVSQQVPSLNSNAVSPADVRRISDLLALLEDSRPDPHQAAAR